MSAHRPDGVSRRSLLSRWWHGLTGQVDRLTDLDTPLPHERTQRRGEQPPCRVCYGDGQGQCSCLVQCGHKRCTGRRES